jgi:hypothetical protein
MRRVDPVRGRGFLNVGLLDRRVAPLLLMNNNVRFLILRWCHTTTVIAASAFGLLLMKFNAKSLISLSATKTNPVIARRRRRRGDPVVSLSNAVAAALDRRVASLLAMTGLGSRRVNQRKARSSSISRRRRRGGMLTMTVWAGGGLAPYSAATPVPIGQATPVPPRPQ